MKTDNIIPLHEEFYIEFLVKKLNLLQHNLKKNITFDTYIFLIFFSKINSGKKASEK